MIFKKSSCKFKTMMKNDKKSHLENDKVGHF